MNSTSLYAAIDLGSNSFHMLVVRVAVVTIWYQKLRYRR